MLKVLLDLNNPNFQEELFSLEKAEQTAFLKTCKKLRQMDWSMIYQDQGLKWEEITSKRTAAERIYSIRVTKKFRATLLRDKNIMVFIFLNPDHDSAYR